MKQNAKNKVDEKSYHRTARDSGSIFGLIVFCGFTKDNNRTKISAGLF
jgi:hypothetical protein